MERTENKNLNIKEEILDNSLLDKLPSSDFSVSTISLLGPIVAFSSIVIPITFVFLERPQPQILEVIQYQSLIKNGSKPNTTIPN